MLSTRTRTLVLYLLTLAALVLNFLIIYHFTGTSHVIDGLNISLSQIVLSILLAATLGAFGALFFSNAIARYMVGVNLLKQPDTYLEKWLFECVARQSRQLGIPQPHIGIFYSSDLNAFTTGWSKKHAMLVVSSGLLESLKQDELEAVIGHELAHIENDDMIALSVAQGIVVSFTLLPAKLMGTLDKLILRNDKDNGIMYLITYWFCMCLFGLLPHTLVMWISRQREFTADRVSAMLNGENKMIAALETLLSNARHRMITEQITARGITGGLMENISGKFSYVREYLSSHPSLNKRITAIQNKSQTDYFVN